MTAKVARLSYFFPAHNEEANLEGLVAEALEKLPTLTTRFKILIIDNNSRDTTPGRYWKSASALEQTSLNGFEPEPEPPELISLMKLSKILRIGYEFTTCPNRNP